MYSDGWRHAAYGSLSMKIVLRYPSVKTHLHIESLLAESTCQ